MAVNTDQDSPKDDHPVDRFVANGKELIYDRTGPMGPILEEVDDLAAVANLRLLITGESGTGKEGIARRIHEKSPRKKHPFIPVNCSAIPEHLVESILFGHEQGAFTGAIKKQIGKFEQANGGTLFLDEIGDMPLPMQAKLLRALQEKEFTRVGGTEMVRASPRIIAATNQDLQLAVKEGRFREDLYYRLCSNATTIRLPSLREREADIPLLAEHYIQAAAKELEIEKPTLSPEAIGVMQNYSWPGNVRELETTMLAAVVRSRKATDKIITPEMLRLNTGHAEAAAAEPQDAMPLKDKFGYKLAKHREDRGWLQTTLAEKASQSAGREISPDDINRWEGNKEVPEQNIVAALAYALIIESKKPVTKKLEQLEEFFAAADNARTAGPAEAEGKKFGDLLRDLREKTAFKTQTELGRLAERVTRFTGEVELGWEDVYRIERDDPHRPVKPAEALALVGALDAVEPLTVKQKMELYESARHAFSKYNEENDLASIKEKLKILLTDDGKVTIAKLATDSGVHRTLLTRFFNEPEKTLHADNKTLLATYCDNTGKREEFDKLMAKLAVALDTRTLPASQ